MRLKSKFIEAVTECQSKARPLTDFKVMLVMHGLGDSMGPYEELTKEINITGLNYLLLNAPEAYFTGFAWYPLGAKDPESALKNSVQLIINEINFLIDEGFSPSDIILCGFSQGGNMALSAALEYKKVIAGVVALSPRTYPFMLQKIEAPFLKTPLFIAHGEEDEVIPFLETKAWTDKLKEKHKSVRFESYQMGHEIDPTQVGHLREWLNELI